MRKMPKKPYFMGFFGIYKEEGKLFEKVEK